MKSFITAVLITVCGATLAAGAAAQDRGGPPPAVPADLGRVTRAMVSNILELVDDPATAKRLAGFSRRYYDALLDRGFTQDQAIRIVVGTGLPGLR